ncbi:MAG: hypothetical protein Q8R48_06345 [Candidatus Omnitrophota bacterium]|nr:hypothetical protein [Candidatus Omnitrophota bacterium]
MMRVDLVGWALLLIALAMSYSVLIKTGKTDNKNLKMLGYIISVIILAAVLILAISDLGSRVRMKRGGIAGPRRTAAPVKPGVNMPAIPRSPRVSQETMPVMPELPSPPAPKVQ